MCASARDIVAYGNSDIASKMQIKSGNFEMDDGKLIIKAKLFAKDIVFLTRDIRENRHEYVMSNQLLRSGTSIGANIFEAKYAQSKMDFISKLEIALKESYESEYWLDLLFETDYLEESTYRALKNNCGAIRKMLISSCTTAKNNN